MAGGCSLDLRAVPDLVDEMRDFNDILGSDCPSKKQCVDCGTSKTPLWRGGPTGPKSLCNACGIRSRKKRWVLLQATKVSVKKDNNNISEKKMKHVVIDTNTSSNTNGSNCNSSSSSSSKGGGNSSDSSSKDKLMAMWQVLKPRNVTIEELNEEQQAAVLLMALSHGFNYS